MVPDPAHVQGELHVIWAHGQQAPYYGPDQLKYHGKNSRWEEASSPVLSPSPSHSSSPSVSLSFTATYLSPRGVTVVDFGSSSTGFSPLQVGSLLQPVRSQLSPPSNLLPATLSHFQVGLGVSCLLLVLLLALQVPNSQLSLQNNLKCGIASVTENRLKSSSPWSSLIPMLRLLKTLTGSCPALTRPPTGHSTSASSLSSSTCDTF